MSLFCSEVGDHLEIYIFSMLALHLFFKWLQFTPHKHEPKVMAMIGKMRVILWTITAIYSSIANSKFLSWQNDSYFAYCGSEW